MGKSIEHVLSLHSQKAITKLSERSNKGIRRLETHRRPRDTTLNGRSVAKNHPILTKPWCQLGYIKSAATPTARAMTMAPPLVARLMAEPV